MQVSNLPRWKRQGPSSYHIADEGLSMLAGNEAAFVVRPKSAAAKPLAAPAAHEPRYMVMEGADKNFYMGQHRTDLL